MQNTFKSMAYYIKFWLLLINDYCMEKVTDFLATRLNIGLLPTQSRWGLVAVLSSFALFFIALFPAIFAIYLSSQEGTMKDALLIVAIVVACIGFLISFFTASLSTYFLRHQKTDVFIQTMDNMKSEIKIETTQIHSDLKVLNELPLIRQTLDKIAKALTESRKDNDTTK